MKVGPGNRRHSRVADFEIVIEIEIKGSVLDAGRRNFDFDHWTMSSRRLRGARILKGAHYGAEPSPALPMDAILDRVRSL